MATEYEITVNLANLSKGTEVEIPGLGLFENGYTYTLTPEQTEAFRLLHAQEEAELDDDGVVISSEVKPGPTPVKANWPEGVTVSTAKAKAKDAAASEAPEGDEE